MPSLRACGRAAPEEAVVAEHELRVRARGALEQLESRGNAGDDGLDFPRSGYLKSIGAVVGELRYFEEFVDMGQEGVAIGHVR